MRLAPARVNAFLQRPDGCRVVLLYGEDHGMIANRAETLVRAAAGSLTDPFLVVEMTRDELPRLPDEAASLPLIPGRRAIRVRGVTDTAAMNAVQLVLQSAAPALVVLEGPGLPSRSRLRTLLEAAPDGAAIGCYPEQGRALADTVRSKLGESGITVDRDALAWLESYLGGDQAATQSELEKLSLYVGPSGVVDFAAATTCVGDSAGLSLDDALYAATAGDTATADRALELAAAEGATPVGVIRAAVLHLHRLYRGALAMRGGMSADDVVSGMRPPVFGPRRNAWVRALQRWSAGDLAAMMARLNRTERDCKRTGSPDHALARHAVLMLAHYAASRRERVV